VGTISAYILLITLYALEIYAFVKKDFSVRFTLAIVVTYIIHLLLIFVSNVNYFMVLAYMFDTILLFIIILRTIIARFPSEEDGN